MATVKTVEDLVQAEGAKLFRTLAETSNPGIRGALWYSVYDIGNIPEWEDELEYELAQGLDRKYSVHGVRNERYGVLNRGTVWGVNTRDVDVQQFALDSLGKPIYKKKNTNGTVASKLIAANQKVSVEDIELKDVELPQGSVWVRAEKILDIKLEDLGKDRRQGFAPGVVKHNGRLYNVYAIPKENLRAVPRAALVLSKRRMQNYGGWKINSFSMGPLYLQVIKYKPGARYESTNVLMIKDTTDFDKEMRDYIDFLHKEQNVIPNVFSEDYMGSDGVRFFIKHLEPTLTTLDDPNADDNIEIDHIGGLEEGSAAADMLASILSKQKQQEAPKLPPSHGEDGRFVSRNR